MFPSLEPALRLQRLAPPARRPVRMVLDTDTFNEVDDQFAVVHALLSPASMTVEGVHAAPFDNPRAAGPADGMEKSHEEILRLFSRLGRAPGGLVRQGSPGFLPGPTSPIESEAARALVRLAATATPDDPLYVVAVGAPTNVAAALLLEPSLVERIVVVWLGAHGSGELRTDEFNCRQDIHATRMLFDSGVPLVWLPCRGVISHMLTTIAELEHYLRKGSPVAEFLLERVIGYGEGKPAAWSKVIWDLAATAWLVEPSWLPSDLVPSPQFDDAFHWRPADPSRHLVRRVRFVQRDPIFGDLFAKLAALPRVS